MSQSISTAESAGEDPMIISGTEVKEDSGKPVGAMEVDDEKPSEESDKPEDVLELEKELSERKGFTSEAFKIELNGLPRFFGVGQARKFLTKNKVNFHKIRPCGHNATYMFINFKNEEDREKAILILDGISVKGRKLKAFKAKAAKDPMLKKIETQKKDVVEDKRPVLERIKSAVCPLHHLSYDEQIAQKTEEILGFLNEVRKETLEVLKTEKIVDQLKEEGGEEVAKLEPFVRSPVTEGYRNKCEFSIGPNPETNEMTVGFRLSSYKKGSVSVVGVQDLPIVSEKMKKTVLHFEKYVRTSGFESYNTISQVGNWRQLTLRTTQNDDLMAWVVVNPIGLSDEDKDKIRVGIKTHFKDFEFQITSLNIQFFGKKSKGEADPEVELLSGSPFIVEKLLNLEFMISPQAFFQINTEGAELLYKKIGDLANLDSDSTLIDVCCGTGTIGLCLASRCAKVYGVDIVEDAVGDAKKNAERNQITNSEFIAGRAEFHLTNILKQSKDQSKTVAVVDPPRAGLHPKAVNAIRSSKITKLIYVSCDAKAAKNNFISLARPMSNAFPGEPFIPRRVIPVDLFPHTNHYELIIMFERMK